VFQDLRFLTACKDYFANESHVMSSKWQRSPFLALKSSVFRDKTTTFCVEEPAKHTATPVNSPEVCSYTWYRDMETNTAYSAQFPESRSSTFAQIHLFTPGGTQTVVIMQLNLSCELYLKLEEEMEVVIRERKDDKLKWKATDPKKKKKTFGV